MKTDSNLELVKPTLKVDLDINLPEIPPIQFRYYRRLCKES